MSSMDIIRHTPGPWFRTGRTIYALMHHDIEQLRSRFSAYVQHDREHEDVLALFDKTIARFRAAA